MVEVKKLSFQELILLNWLCEGVESGKIGRIYETFRSMGNESQYRRYLQFDQEQGKSSALGKSEEIEKQIGISRRVELSNLLRNEYLRRAGDETMKKFALKEHYATSYYVPSKKGYEYWLSSGKNDYLKQREMKKPKEHEFGTIIIKGYHTIVCSAEDRRFSPHDIKIERPWAMAKVVQETPERFYIEDIKNLEELVKDNNIKKDFIYELIKSYNGRYYIEKEKVMMKNATVEDFQKLNEFFKRRVMLVEDENATLVNAMKSVLENRIKKLEEAENIYNEEKESLIGSPQPSIKI